MSESIFEIYGKAIDERYKALDQVCSRAAELCRAVEGLIRPENIENGVDFRTSEWITAYEAMIRTREALDKCGVSK